MGFVTNCNHVVKAKMSMLRFWQFTASGIKEMIRKL